MAVIETVPHQPLSLVVQVAFSSHQLVPRLHSVCTTLHDVGRFEAVANALRKIVERDLVPGRGLVRGVEPSAALAFRRNYPSATLARS